MKVFPIRIFSDNYAYVVTGNDNSCVLIDPADWRTVKNFLHSIPELQNKQVTKVFSTHKHWDHTRDNNQIKKEIPRLEIVGGRQDKVPGCTLNVIEGQTINLSSGIIVTCIHTPCHTRGHMLYFFEDGSKRAVFTGDTLFIGGCGKFFEGKADEMLEAMRKLRSLPPDTLVYCGHEYTVQNLTWSEKIEPSNENIKEKLQWALNQVSQRRPTVPSTIEEESSINVFMRTFELMQLLGTRSEVQTMEILREMKNSRRSFK